MEQDTRITEVITVIEEDGQPYEAVVTYGPRQELDYMSRLEKFLINRGQLRRNKCTRM